MKNRIYPISLFLVFIFSCSCANGGSIHGEGLKNSGKNYFDKIVQSDEFDYTLYLIEYGNEESINFSKGLIKYTDAAKTESILFSLGRALNKNTEAVLRLMKDEKGFTIEQICTVPFIEAPSDIEKIHINQAIYNLGRIKEKELEETRDKCLKLFKEMKDP